MSICLAIADADWALTKDVFSVFGTMVSAIGVGLAAWIGFSGLATWRRQNKGTSDHDLSRRLLIDLYQLRDRIKHARNSLILAGEGGVDDQDQFLNFLQISYRNTARSYKKRLALIDEVRVRLSASLLESEAVWGDQLRSRFEPIFKLQNELFLNVRAYLITINPDEEDETIEAYRNILKSRRDVRCQASLEDEDGFQIEFDEALSRVEDYLRPKLIR